ncbi:MAG: hypothetical protein AAF705_12045 [Bacteroidota bacterium]
MKYENKLKLFIQLKRIAMKTLLMILLSACFFNGTPIAQEAPAPTQDGCVLVIHGTATLADGTQIPMTLEGKGKTCEEAREGMKEAIIDLQLRRLR